MTDRDFDPLRVIEHLDKQREAIDELAEDIADNPGVVEVGQHGTELTIYIEGFRLPDGFRDWIEAEDLTITDVVGIPERDTLAVTVKPVEAIPRLSTPRRMVEALGPYLDSDVSVTQAVDHYVTESGELTQTAWGERRGTPQGSIGSSVARAREQLGRDDS